jgi:hypothetical protein
MRDKTNSYKFTGGKFVERTAEEVATLEQLWAKQAHKTKSAGRILRSEERFVKLTLLQLEKLFGLSSQACTLLFWPCCTRISGTESRPLSCQPTGSPSREALAAEPSIGHYSGWRRVV